MALDELFDNLRHGPWHNVDPNEVPQQGAMGTGNVEPSGWLADDSVSADVIQANSITAEKIQAGAITASKIAAGAITASSISSGSITADKISSGAITADKIAANAVTTDKVAANAITAAKIQAGTIQAGQLAAESVTASKIAANAVTADAIAANAVTANEIAANAITTSKIAAGEVTSSRIELTITGKRFGANSGSEAAPGVFFTSSGNTGLFLTGGSIAVATGGTTRFNFGAFSGNLAATIRPLSGSADLGAIGFPWDTVYRLSESSLSDRRKKRDIADAPLGLEFVRRLRPRVYRWREAKDTQAGIEAEHACDVAAMERECVPIEQAIEAVMLARDAGQMDDHRAGLQIAGLARRLDRVRQRYLAPLEAARNKRRPGRRLHHGLIAQEVKKALDAAGVDPMDAAFWQKAPNGEQSLSYTELMIPLLKAVQELADKVDALESRP